MMSTILFLSTASLGFLTVKLYQEVIRLNQEKEYFVQSLNQYQGIISKEETERSLEHEIQVKKYCLSELEYQINEISKQIKINQSQLAESESELYIRSLGYYEPQYNFLLLDDYKAQFRAIEYERKRLIANNRAVLSHQNWIVMDDPVKGRKMIENYITVIRDAFDVVCTSAVGDVKNKNLERLKRKVIKNLKRLNKQSKILGCEISEEYKDNWLRALDLKYEMEMRRLEKNEQKKLRDEKLRAEKKERQKIEKALKAQQEAEAQVIEYQMRCKEIDEQIEFITKQNREQDKKKLNELMKQNEQYKIQIINAQNNAEKARTDHRLIKSGFIYIVSNERSFGRNVYRIFMTKRSDPRSCVSGMNPFVPFRFLWHIEAECNDVANALEKIHQDLHSKRVNKSNQRRDFFKVSLSEIRDVIYDVKSKGESIIEIIENEDDGVFF